eukprot:Nk52_evm1s628 gene=Nk52_evmTU1s628
MFTIKFNAHGIKAKPKASFSKLPSRNAALFVGTVAVLCLILLLASGCHAKRKERFQQAWVVSFVDRPVMSRRSDPEMDMMADHVAASRGYVNLGQVGQFQGVYQFSRDCKLEEKSDLDFESDKQRMHFCSQRRGRRAPHSDADLLWERGVKWVEQLSPLKRVRRDSLSEESLVDSEFRKKIHRNPFHFTDPLLNEQWHIYNEEDQVQDMVVAGAWNLGYTGKGILVSVIDDGLEREHDDMTANFNPECSYDFNFEKNDPTPRYEDPGGIPTSINNHGTRCAGVIGATTNTSCGVGIAFDAQLCGVKIIDGNPTDVMEAKAFSHANDKVHIYSSSWGPTDDGATVDGPRGLAQEALIYGTTEGRDGKGILYIFASGNGGYKADNCNLDGYTNSIRTITIGSVSRNYGIPSYAESCAIQLGVTYSGGGLGGMGGRAITTTDIRHGCTHSHSGTSASAPIAAGMFALVLQANPDLTYRDIKHLIVNTARPFKLEHDQWKVNGVGRLYHNFFSFGVMNTAKMIEAAKKWKTVGPRVEHSSPMIHVYQPIVPGDTRGVEVSFNVTDTSLSNVTMEYGIAALTIKHPHRGELEIYLISPLGTVSQVLTKRWNDKYGSDFDRWNFTSAMFWDEPVLGNWKVRVVQRGTEFGGGTLESCQFLYFGAAGGNPNRLRNVLKLEEVPQAIRDRMENIIKNPHQTEVWAEPESSNHSISGWAFQGLYKFLDWRKWLKVLGKVLEEKAEKSKEAKDVKSAEGAGPASGGVQQ